MSECWDLTHFHHLGGYRFHLTKCKRYFTHTQTHTHRKGEAGDEGIEEGKGKRERVRVEEEKDSEGGWEGEGRRDSRNGREGEREGKTRERGRGEPGLGR